MSVIEITKEYGVEIVLCTNAEVLGVDNEELVRRAVRRQQEYIFDVLGDYAEEDGIFSHWRGGRYQSPYNICVEWFRREPDGGETIVTWDDIEFTDWSFIQSHEVPEVLQLGMDEIIDNLLAIRYKVLEEVTSR